MLASRGWGGAVVSTGEWQHARHGGPAIDVLMRLNPGVIPGTRREFAVGSQASKFGMPEAEIRRLARSAAEDCPGLTVRGIHVHVGSALTDVGAWALAGVRATGLLADIGDSCPRADTVDYCGGFPLPWPGRPGPAQLMRPALYGSMHRVHALRPRTSPRPTAVDGPVCEITDSFGTHQLPPLRRGDLVAIEQAGAYAASFTSRSNGRPHPAEVLLGDGGELTLCERPALQAAYHQRARRQPSAETSLA